MSTIINEYLNRVRANLRLEAPAEKEILSELAAHIEDEVSDLKKKGLRDEEAENTCLKFLGSAKTVAKTIYESHSQGTWKQAVMASLPHILFGVIFILNWWQGITPVLLTLIGISITAVFGWWHGRSSWLFPWLGYAFMPVLAAGLSLLYLPTGLSWVAILVYIPMAVWLVLRVCNQTIKKDWLYLSLMLLPLPVIMAWFAVNEVSNPQDIKAFFSITAYGPWIGACFLALGLGVVFFVRIRKRWLKIGVLFVTGISSLVLVASYAGGRISTIGFLLLVLFMTGIFLIPAMLENGVKSGKWGKIFENRPR